MEKADKLTLVPLTLHWTMGSGAPSASQISTLEVPSEPGVSVRSLIRGLPGQRRGATYYEFKQSQIHKHVMHSYWIMYSVSIDAV